MRIQHYNDTADDVIGSSDVIGHGHMTIRLRMNVFLFVLNRNQTSLV